MQEKLELARLLEEKTRRLTFNALRYYSPYAKQRQFHDASATFRERLFMAGNQLGKTVAGGNEVAMHLTGLYPDWWEGRRFDEPTSWWASGVTSESTRDNPQRILLGPPQDQSMWGSGTIPQVSIERVKPKRGVPDAVDSIVVRHVSGGKSVVVFKSYDQGRQKWQGETLHGIWYDEEPPPDIYSEGVTRTNRRQGLNLITFTPLLGMTDVVRQFMEDTAEDSGKHITRMGIDEAEHYSPEERRAIILSYPEHEREARAKGVPIMGSGRVFPIAESSITVPAFSIPPTWPQIGGMDFGWDHPFAAVKLAHDPDSDIVYVTSEYKKSQATPLIHSGALKPWGAFPWAWPHDGYQHDKGSGEELKKQYADHGLAMIEKHAQFEDGKNGVEAGIMLMLERMETGRFKVFAHLEEWFKEFRLYHRKDGVIVKVNDDLMAATRYAVMMLRYAKVAQSQRKNLPKPNLKWVV